MASAVERWFEANARPSPWRPADLRAPRNPYLSLLSEVMLQQTQAARVVERLPAFLARFPDLATLARARESSVLAAWSGLGYYRRARLLHACAREIVARHGGVVPGDPSCLRALPGLGAYTAGAIASIAFRARVPIVDANITRVALRIRGLELAPKDPLANAASWAFAERMVEAADDPGLLNEGLMELGALICTTRAPKCASCPVLEWCGARRAGCEAEIPLRAPSAARTTVYHSCVVVREGDRTLVQRRPSDRGGLWAGLWQPPTIERADRPATSAEVRARLGFRAVARAGAFTFFTTHREVRFDVWNADPGKSRPDGRWVATSALSRLALASPHRRILLGDSGEAGRYTLRPAKDPSARARGSGKDSTAPVGRRPERDSTGRPRTTRGTSRGDAGTTSTRRRTKEPQHS